MPPPLNEKTQQKIRLILSDAPLAKRLGDALEAAGYSVAISSQPGEGVAACRVETPRLVFLGLESQVAETCRALEGTTVVLLVREGESVNLDEGCRAGAADFQRVPCSPDEIVRRAELVLSRAGQEALAQTRVTAGAGLLASHAIGTRDQMLDAIEAALQAGPQAGRSAAVLCVDLFQAKALRGALSREATNRLEAGIGRRLRESVRECEVLAQVGSSPDDVRVARTGGEEFSLLVPGVSDEADATQLGKRVLEFLSEPFSFDGQDVFVTVSIGSAVQSKLHGGAEDLLKCAETAAYCGRQQGHSTLLAYSPAMDARAFERLSLESGLRRALERSELMVYYQPRVDIASGKIDSFEALIRWRHPELGLVSPGQFIPLAEETGLIVPIGEMVIDTACRQIQAWSQAGLPEVKVSVNLSAVQFRQPDLFESVEGILQRTGLDPKRLELELTESLLMQNPENAVATLNRFSNFGIRLSIDDFGTGYSSLSYLKRFPIDSLKIDQSFIRELTSNTDDAAIVTSIILMGKALKLRVVAEGVETRSQLSFLKVMQCHEAQGYLFSRPVPANEAEEILRSGTSLLEAA